MTTNKSLNTPANGSFIGDWDIPINANWNSIDNAFAGTTSINVGGASGTVSLTLAQYTPPIIRLSGTLTSNVNYQFPTGIGWFGTVFNGTSGAFTVTFSSAGAGGTLNIPQGSSLVVSCDTTNVFGSQSFAVAAGSNTQVQFNNSGALGGSSGLTWSGSALTATAFSGPLTGNVTGNASTASTLAASVNFSYTGDATGGPTSFNGASSVSTGLTLATVNSNVGSFGSSSAVPVITVNGKGLITAASTASLAAYAPLNSPAFTGGPTAPTFATPTDTSSRIATDAFVWNAIGNALAANLAVPGHLTIVIGSGVFILNWGTYSLASAGGSTQAVTFDAAFPNAYLAGWCGVDGSATNQIGVIGGSGTTTGMTIAKGSSDGSARTGPWFAIGH